VVCLGPRVPGESVGPRPLSGVVMRPLNFTVRRTRRDRSIRRLPMSVSHQYLHAQLCANSPMAEIGMANFKYEVTCRTLLERSHCAGALADMAGDSLLHGVGPRGSRLANMAAHAAVALSGLGVVHDGPSNNRWRGP
jgi:hypothetical protein